jgi:hypothetical protein
MVSLPSVHSLIAMFSRPSNDLGHDLHVTSTPTSKFDSSRKKWSSMPRLNQTLSPVTSSQTPVTSRSTSKPRSGSAHYEWSPASLSWVTMTSDMSAKPEERRRALSERRPTKVFLFSSI